MVFFIFLNLINLHLYLYVLHAQHTCCTHTLMHLHTHAHVHNTNIHNAQCVCTVHTFYLHHRLIACTQYTHFPITTPHFYIIKHSSFHVCRCHKMNCRCFCHSQGESIGPNEATEAFFAMTKLFQSKDVSVTNLFNFFCTVEHLSLHLLFCASFRLHTFTTILPLKKKIC